jgi:ribose-phosphate pyrophosphokinase
MKLLACNSNPVLAQAMAAYLNVPLTSATVKRFPDMEVFVEIHENVRGEDVFVVQSTSYPANDHIMELLVSLDALRRASARRITAVIPYADRVLTVDLHAGQIQGFFDIPLDHLYAAPVVVADIKANYKEKNVVIVSPDVGGVVRARALAKRLNADLAIVDKRRERAGVSEVMNIIGEVEGRHCILYDDIVDSAGTLCNAADAIKKNGAASVAAYVTHGVLAGKAIERVEASALTSLVITDSIAATAAVKSAKNIRVMSIAPLLAEAIRRISEESSVSSLFD